MSVSIIKGCALRRCKLHPLRPIELVCDGVKYERNVSHGAEPNATLILNSSMRKSLALTFRSLRRTMSVDERCQLCIAGFQARFLRIDDNL